MANARAHHFPSLFPIHILLARTPYFSLKLSLSACRQPRISAFSRTRVSFYLIPLLLPLLFPLFFSPWNFRTTPAGDINLLPALNRQPLATPSFYCASEGQRGQIVLSSVAGEKILSSYLSIYLFLFSFSWFFTFTPPLPCLPVNLFYMLPFLTLFSPIIFLSFSRHLDSPFSPPFRTLSPSAFVFSYFALLSPHSPSYLV